MAEGPMTGQQCYFYYDSASSVGSPTWVQVKNVIDLDTENGNDAVDASARYSGSKMSIPGLSPDSITLSYEYFRGTDTPREFFQTAKNNKSAVQLAIADGPIATVGTEYHKGWYMVEDFSTSQPLADRVTVSIKFALTVKIDSGSVLEPSDTTVAS